MGGCDKCEGAEGCGDGVKDAGCSCLVWKQEGSFAATLSSPLKIKKLNKRKVKKG